MEWPQPSEADFDLYDALNLQRNASGDDVRASFRELSRIYHPDKHSGVAGGASSSGGEGAFMQIHRAYKILSDDVLRSFYDRYGLPGLRVAENVSDEDGVYGNHLALPEDRLKDLESRVRQLVARHTELRTQRLLALQGSFTLSLAAAPGPHGAHFRRRYKLQYSATSHSVQVNLCESVRLSIGCAAHVQGANGVGAAKLMLAATTQLGTLTSLRTAVNVTGSSPEFEVNLGRTISPGCSVQQKVSMSADGGSMALTVHPWLSRTLRGSLGYSCGEDPSISLGLIRSRSASSSNIGARAFLTMQPGSGELGTQFKFKPSKDFSVKLAPSISAQGWAVQATCTKAASDGLTKMQWALRVRRRNLSLRLTVLRAGLRFSFPIELWPEAAGPLTLNELGLGLVLWAGPPLVIRLLRGLGQAVVDAARGPSTAATASPAASLRSPGTAAADRSTVAAAASEQQQLLAQEALRRRSEEAAHRGLEILAAKYGDPLVAENDTSSGKMVDVTDCIMAKVRQSQLHISNAPKSSLFGFYDPGNGRGNPVLKVSYRFGGVEYSRVFGNTEAVVLP